MQEKRGIRTIGDLLAAFGGVAEGLRTAGIDINGNAKAWQQGQQQIKQRLEDVSGFVASGIREALPYIPDVFQCLQEREIPLPLRDTFQIACKDIGKGPDESVSIISLAGQFRIPKQLPVPLDEATEKKYINQVKQGLIGLQKQFDAGLLDKIGFNSLLDFGMKDEFDDAFQDVKAFVKKYLPEVGKELDNFFGANAIKSATQAFRDWTKCKPKNKSFARRYLEGIGFLRRK